MRVALVYDRLNKMGGAEVILQSFHTLYPGADWYTSVWDESRTPFTRGWRVNTSWLSRIPFVRTRHEWIPWLMPFVFETFDFRVYDLVISIGSAEAKGIVTRPETLHLHYCLTPTRYLYSHQSEYLSNPLYRAIAKPLRAWDQVAAYRPDHMIAISEQVKKRIKKYYNRQSLVVYPPVNTKKFSKPQTSNIQNLQPNYYLVVSRLVPYKKIDLVIQACNAMQKPLVVVGEGHELSRLKHLSGPTIRVVGHVDSKQLVQYYQGARALIHAGIEDFGIAMVEAQASGKPVIAYREGGACEIVKNGQTGILFRSQTVHGICQAVDTFETMTIDPNACRESALRFDERQWQQIMQATIKELWRTRLQTLKY